jgi:hypothetical protein
MTAAKGVIQGTSGFKGVAGGAVAAISDLPQRFEGSIPSTPLFYSSTCSVSAEVSDVQRNKEVDERDPIATAQTPYTNHTA